jgi:hypothetical protein
MIGGQSGGTQSLLEEEVRMVLLTTSTAGKRDNIAK